MAKQVSFRFFINEGEYSGASVLSGRVFVAALDKCKFFSALVKETTSSPNVIPVYTHNLIDPVEAICILRRLNELYLTERTSEIKQSTLRRMNLSPQLFLKRRRRRLKRKKKTPETTTTSECCHWH